MQNNNNSKATIIDLFTSKVFLRWRRGQGVDLCSDPLVRWIVGLVDVLFCLEKFGIFPQPTEEFWTTAVRGDNQPISVFPLQYVKSKYSVRERVIFFHRTQRSLSRWLIWVLPEVVCLCVPRLRSAVICSWQVECRVLTLDCMQDIYRCNCEHYLSPCNVFKFNTGGRKPLQPRYKHGTAESFSPSSPFIGQHQYWWGRYLPRQTNDALRHGPLRWGAPGGLDQSERAITPSGETHSVLLDLNTNQLVCGVMSPRPRAISEGQWGLVCSSWLHIHTSALLWF